MSKPTLYHFNPNDFGAEFFVIAASRTHAHECLISYLRNQLENSNATDAGFIQSSIDSWMAVNPLDPSTFPAEYTLDEYGACEVIESEIA